MPPLIQDSSFSLETQVTMFSDMEHSYTNVCIEKSSEDDDSSDDGTISPSRSLLGAYQNRLRSRFNRRTILGCAVVALWLVSLVVSFWVGKFGIDLDKKCLEHTSAYSPALKQMKPGYKMVQFNGTLGYSNEYTGGPGGDPNPEVDAAWEKWAYVKYASIPDDQFFKLPGADPHASKLTPEYGGGYIGFLEVSHHMHCLNLLRKGVHREYYMNSSHKALEFSDRPWTIKLHLDVGMITHQWVKGIPDPFANFNTWHKCRDIESVEKWIHANEIPTTPDNHELPIPIGSKIYPTPP